MLKKHRQQPFYFKKANSRACAIILTSFFKRVDKKNALRFFLASDSFTKWKICSINPLLKKQR